MEKRVIVKKEESPVEERIIPRGVTTVHKDGHLYRKIGGGSLKYANRIIKPNERVLIRLEEIPKSFHDLFIPLEDIPEPVTVAKQGITKPNPYKLKAKRGGWYDIIGPDEKVLNEKPMRKAEAELMLENL